MSVGGSPKQGRTQGWFPGSGGLKELAQLGATEKRLSAELAPGRRSCFWWKTEWNRAWKESSGR